MRSRLQAVGEEAVPDLVGAPVEPKVSHETSAAQSALMGLLLTSLRALSQRAVVALASLVDLALIASVFVLCLLVIDQPTPLQLTEAAGYAAFVIGAIVLRKR